MKQVSFLKSIQLIYNILFFKHNETFITRLTTHVYKTKIKNYLFSLRPNKQNLHEQENILSIAKMK